MPVPRCSNRMPVNLIIDDTNEIISLEQAGFLIDRQKNEGCTPECLSCHFRERYLRDLDPDIIESVLANEYQVTNRPVQGGEMIVGWIDDVPVIIPDAIFWDILQLHDLENEQIRKYIKRSWKFPLSGAYIRMIFSHYEDGLDRDEDGCPIYPDEIEPPAHDGNPIEALPTTPITARLGRPRTSFSMVPPEYSPRPRWNGIELTHPREVVAHGGQVAPFYPTGVTPEPPTYRSCGPFEQPPEYEPQYLPSSVVSSPTVSATAATSDAGPSTLGQGLSDIFTSSAVQNTLTGEPAANPPLAPPRNPTRLQAQSVHVPRLRAPSSDQKYTYTSERPEAVLPSLEQVIRYLNLPRLVKQDANYASLPDMVEEAVAAMDHMIDDLVDRVQNLDFEDPRTPPPIPSSTASSASLSDFPVPPGSSESLSPSNQSVPAGRSSLSDRDSDSDDGEVESVGYGNRHDTDPSDNGDEVFYGGGEFCPEAITDICTEAISQMIAQDDVAHKVLSFYPSDTFWDFATLMHAFDQMKLKRSPRQAEGLNGRMDGESEDLGFNVDPQSLNDFLVQLPDDLLTNRPAVFDSAPWQLADYTHAEVMAAESPGGVATVVCCTIVQELLTADSVIHRIVARYPPDAKYDLQDLVQILRAVAYWRRQDANDALYLIQDRQEMLLEGQGMPEGTIDPEVEAYCDDLEEPELQAITFLGSYFQPYCIKAAKKENPELMKAILEHFPKEMKWTTTISQAVFDLIELGRKDRDQRLRDEEARDSLDEAITTINDLLDDVSTYEITADVEAQVDHPTSPTIFNNPLTDIDAPTSPSTFNSGRPTMSDELFLPTSPTILTTAYTSRDGSHNSLASQIGRTGWSVVYPPHGMRPQGYRPDTDLHRPISPHTVATTFETQERQYQAYHPGSSPRRPRPYYPGETPVTPSSPSTPPPVTTNTHSSSLNTHTTFASAARTIRELYAFSQWRFALIRDYEYLDDNMADAIARFAERVSNVKAEIDSLRDVDLATSTASRSGRRGAVSE